MMHDFDALAADWDSEPHRVKRAKDVAEAIRAGVPGMEGMRALEYGCGTGSLSFCLYEYLQYIVLADTSAGMLAVLQEKIDKAALTHMMPLQMDLSETVPDSFEPVDLVYVLMTLHHIRDVEKTIQNLARVLKPGGYLCIADLVEEDGSYHGEGFDGHKGFSRAYLSGVYAGAGFDTLTWSIAHHCSKKVASGEERVFPVFLLVGQKA